MRAIVLQGAIAQLTSAGHFDDYRVHLPAFHLEAATLALASSWLPVEVYNAHLDALEGMGLSDAQISQIAEALGANLFDHLFATIVRAVRSAGGGAGIWFGFKQADRVISRIYKGGVCVITQIGPKDALYEMKGLPGAQSRASRLSQAAFFRGVIGITAKACVVKPLPTTRDGETLALNISWV